MIYDQAADDSSPGKQKIYAPNIIPTQEQTWQRTGGWRWIRYQWSANGQPAIVGQKIKCVCSSIIRHWRVYLTIRRARSDSHPSSTIYPRTVSELDHINKLNTCFEPSGATSVGQATNEQQQPCCCPVVRVISWTWVTNNLGCCGWKATGYVLVVVLWNQVVDNIICQ